MKTTKTPAVPVFLTLAACALALVSCSRNKSAALAIVGSDAITAEDLRREMESAPFAQAEYLSSPAGRKELLELMVRRKVVLAEAKRLGILGAKDVKAKLSELETEFGRQKQEAVNRLVIGEFFRSLQNTDLKVADDDVRRYWSEEKEFKTSHILVSDPDKAAALKERLNKGESFEKLAKQFSEDAVTGRQGGDLGYVQRGTLVPEFEKALFALKVGETSGVVVSPFGNHLIRKTDERPLSTHSFEESAEPIRALLEKQKLQSYIEKARARYNVTVDTAALENMKTAEPPAAPTPAPESAPTQQEVKKQS